MWTHFLFEYNQLSWCLESASKNHRWFQREYECCCTIRNVIRNVCEFDEDSWMSQLLKIYIIGALSDFVQFLHQISLFYGWNTFKISKETFDVLQSLITWFQIILHIEFNCVCRNHLHQDCWPKWSILIYCIVIFWHIWCIFWILD